jgi:hypothetical protein
MSFEFEPAVTEPEAEALRDALSRAGIGLDSRPRAYDSAWRRAGMREGVGHDAAERIEDVNSEPDSR